MVSLHPVGPDDRADWETLFRGYAAFYHTDAHAAEDAVWSWIQDPEEPYWSMIARDSDGKALGFVQYSLMHRSLSGALTVYLSDLFTVPAARGKGVGRLLIDHVREFAREGGYASVRWLTQEGNAAARVLYDSYAPASGFILYSVPPAG